MADLLVRRETAFVLWHLAKVEPPPRLIIGWVQPGTPIGLVGEQSLALRITDPLATAVDWRLLGPRLGAPFTEDDRYPATAVKFSAGRLLAADVGGEQPSFSGEPLPDSLPPNNRLVIYEPPTVWTRPGLRRSYDALAANDVELIHTDFDDGKLRRPRIAAGARCRRNAG